MIWKDYFYNVIKNILNRFKTKKDSWLLLAGNILLASINFLIISVLSHNLSPVDYGLLREVLLYTGLLLSVGSAGFSQTLYYLLNREDYKYKADIIVKQIRILQLAILLCLISLILILYLEGLFKYLYLNDLLYIILYITFLIITCVDLNLSIVNKKVEKYIIMNALLLIVKLFVFWLLAIKDFSISYYIFALCFFQGCMFLGNYGLLKSNYFGVKNWMINSEIISLILKYSFPLFLTSIFAFLMYNTDKFIISFFAETKKEFAIISNISFEAPIISTIYLSFFTISLPYMIKAFDKGDFEQVLSERFDYIFKVAKIILPVVVSFIVWSNDYMVLIFGATYKEYGGLFSIFSTISLLRFCSHHDIFLATNNTSYILFYQIIELVFQVILSISLYYFFDLLGLIIASVITNYGYMFFVNLKSSKILKVKFKDILPFAFLIKRVVTLSISAIIVKYVFENIFTNIFWMIPLIIWLLIIAFVEFRILKGQNSQ
jgi:O-antigen/teichoic acid export membrane protein